MKALSVKQPWATWIASGIKTIETRVWATSYRGPLVICSSKVFDMSVLHRVTRNHEAFPLGKAICIVDLVECRMMEPADENAARCQIYAGARAWVLANPIAIEGDPVSVRGKLGLFDVSILDARDMARRQQRAEGLKTEGV